jgi:hypothetical protein
MTIAGFLLAVGPLGACLTTPAGEPPRRWGEKGHEMAARAAVETLSNDVPSFFRDALEQLVYLNPEPDRWRDPSRVEMDQAYAYDHYIDWERVPDRAADAADRFTFLGLLYAEGIARPEQSVGLLPYRILELYERLVTEWRLWREADGTRRGFIEERIVNDAGILGHYVTDAANPHHTTIHFNGWDAATPNPEGYNLDRNFHARFEAAFVARHVDYAAVRERVERRAPESRAGTARRAVFGHILASHAEVERLYRLDRDVGFDPDGPAEPEAVSFAAERLAAGAAMLRDLWWSAWQESAEGP